MAVLLIGCAMLAHIVIAERPIERQQRLWSHKVAHRKARVVQRNVALCKSGHKGRSSHSDWPCIAKASSVGVFHEPPPPENSSWSGFLTSNEKYTYVYKDDVENLGGVMIAAATDQNFIIAGWAKPKVLIFVDFDMRVHHIHKAYNEIFRLAPNIDTFLKLWKGNDGDSQERISDSLSNALRCSNNSDGHKDSGQAAPSGLEAPVSSDEETVEHKTADDKTEDDKTAEGDANQGNAEKENENEHLSEVQKFYKYITSIKASDDDIGANAGAATDRLLRALRAKENERNQESELPESGRKKLSVVVSDTSECERTTRATAVFDPSSFSPRTLEVFNQYRGQVHSRLTQYQSSEYSNLPNFMTNETMYTELRKLYLENRVFTYRGDMRSTRGVMEVLGGILRKNGAKVRILHLTNLEDYASYNTGFRRSVRALPFDKRSLVLRCVFFSDKHSSSLNSDMLGENTRLDRTYIEEPGLHFQRALSDPAVWGVHPLMCLSKCRELKRSWHESAGIHNGLGLFMCDGPLPKQRNYTKGWPAECRPAEDSTPSVVALDANFTAKKEAVPSFVSRNHAQVP